ncbi:hypothetical protein C8Q75DRAFT_811618 [Abortiporus biennis]|nr:hypothetical protein C8Q75DRAFT_811618 [Abortiporus biennis]
MSKAMDAAGVEKPTSTRRRRGHSSGDSYSPSPSRDFLAPPQLSHPHHHHIPLGNPEPPNTPPPLVEARLPALFSGPSSSNATSGIPYYPNSAGGLGLGPSNGPHPGSSPPGSMLPHQWNYRSQSVLSHDRFSSSSQSNYEYSELEIDQAPSPTSSASSNSQPTPSYTFGSHQRHYEYDVHGRGTYSDRSSTSSGYGGDDGGVPLTYTPRRPPHISQSHPHSPPSISSSLQPHSTTSSYPSGYPNHPMSIEYHDSSAALAASCRNDRSFGGGGNGGGIVLAPIRNGSGEFGPMRRRQTFPQTRLDSHSQQQQQISSPPYSPLPGSPNNGTGANSFSQSQHQQQNLLDTQGRPEYFSSGYPALGPNSGFGPTDGGL